MRLYTYFFLTLLIFLLEMGFIYAEEYKDDEIESKFFVNDDFGVIISTNSTLNIGTTITRTIISRKYADIARMQFLLPDGSEQTLIVETLDSKNQLAAITLSNTSTIIKINETKKFDLNKDGFYDTRVRLKRILMNNKAAIFDVTSLDNEDSVNVVVKKEPLVNKTEVQIKTIINDTKTEDLKKSASNIITGQVVLEDSSSLKGHNLTWLLLLLAIIIIGVIYGLNRRKKSRYDDDIRRKRINKILDKALKK